MKLGLLRLCLIFPLLLTAFYALPQIRINTYTPETDTFYWKKYINVPSPDKFSLKKIALKGHRKTIERFCMLRAPDYPQFTVDSLMIRGKQNWVSYLFPVDLNHDNITDVIFSGPAGGESDITRIYLGRDDQFELVFEDYQYISDLRMENHRLVSLQTGDIGCCDEYLYFTRNYRVEWEHDEPVFIKGRQTATYKHTEEPREYFRDPVPFTAVSDTLFLRASAAELNEPFNPYLDNFGNILARYRQKVSGFILARKTLTSGIHWFYIEITPSVYPSASVFYQLEKYPTFLRGWVPGKSVGY